MHIGIIHSAINPAGGAEKVCLVIIEALKNSGHEVELATIAPTDWPRVSEIMGGVVKPDLETSLPQYKAKIFGIYASLLQFLSARKLRKKFDLTINTHADILTIESDIIYLHYPTFVTFMELPVNMKYKQSLFWKTYFKPYSWIHDSILKQFLGKGLILTNSNYSARAIKRHTGKDAVVLYPPVDVEGFLCDNDNRKNLVVSCGRYAPEKNYEFVLEIAARIRDMDFIIMGTSSGRISSSYYEKIENIKQEKDLDNVKLLRDVPLQEQLEIYRRASVYLHCMIGEHFGIAVVEAMASGLIPTIHKSGGAWEDIIDHGKYGYGYDNLDSAIDGIRQSMTNADRLRKEIVERSKIFSKRRFVERVMELINERTKIPKYR